MTPNKYQKEALRTESPIPWMRANDSTFRLLQGLMGLNGEAGEAIDVLKKHLFQGHDLDREHLAKELGDVAWYLGLFVVIEIIGACFKGGKEKTVSDR